jgi:hypothetical protein
MQSSGALRARMLSHVLRIGFRHCEERSDEAIHLPLRGAMDCFASLAMTEQVGRECPTSYYSTAAPTGGPPGGRCKNVIDA